MRIVLRPDEVKYQDQHFASMDANENLFDPGRHAQVAPQSLHMSIGKGVEITVTEQYIIEVHDHPEVRGQWTGAIAAKAEARFRQQHDIPDFITAEECPFEYNPAHYKLYRWQWLVVLTGEDIPEEQRSGYRSPEQRAAEEDQLAKIRYDHAMRNLMHNFTYAEIAAWMTVWANVDAARRVQLEEEAIMDLDDPDDDCDHDEE